MTGGYSRTILVALTSVVIGSASGCTSAVDGGATAAAGSSSPSSVSLRADEDVTQVRAEVPYSTADDRVVTKVAVGLDSSVELIITGDPSGPVHLRGYERYAEPDRGSTVLRFVANRPGRFGVEQDESGRVIAEVEVIDPNRP